MSEKTKNRLTKKRIFDIIQIGNRDDLISRFFDWFIVIVIILNMEYSYIIMQPKSTLKDVLLKIVNQLAYMLKEMTAHYPIPNSYPASTMQQDGQGIME